MGHRWKRKTKRKREHGVCFFPGCGNSACATEHCRLCDGKVTAGKLETEAAYHVSFCKLHGGLAQSQIEQHVLRKHPGTLPAWLLAKLTGKA